MFDNKTYEDAEKWLTMCVRTKQERLERWRALLVAGVNDVTLKAIQDLFEEKPKSKTEGKSRWTFKTS